MKKVEEKERDFSSYIFLKDYNIEESKEQLFS
jgi:hypothetical protein